jgi:iron(III) transport system ATP-binding protein
MVFQSYAIWPHMTVFDNVAFPLRYGPYKLSKQELQERVMRALQLVQIDAMAHRDAPLLSGGQQQRVALARALVYEPSVLLLDEPLSNLDAKLRMEMRTELQTLIRQLEITTLYVTHDQEEALALSDRVAVMEDGLIKQEGASQDIYLRPTSPQVAAFVGRTNFFPGTVEESTGDAVVVACDFGRVACSREAAAAPLARGEAVWVTARPEDAVLHPHGETSATNTYPAIVRQVMFVGSRAQVDLKLAPGRCQVEVDGRNTLRAGDTVHVRFPPDRIRLFPRQGEPVAATTGPAELATAAG